MLEHIPDSMRVNVFAGTVTCEGRDCCEVAEFDVSRHYSPLGGEELISEAYAAADFDDEGFCPECQARQATEEHQQDAAKEARMI